MPPAHRRCSECGQALASRAVTSKTCSEKCRASRYRRIKRARRDEENFKQEHGEAAVTVAEIVRGESRDVITRVMHEELQPVVREALTEDVLRAVNGMLALTPRAVELIQDDLESDDGTVRQRAYTLITKYTIGHPALLQPKDADPGGQLVVNFNLPRPEPQLDEPLVAVELMQCDMCSQDFPSSDFVAGSQRCPDCFAKWKADVLEQFT